jgi:GT2 family glycosyltransferase
MVYSHYEIIDTAGEVTGHGLRCEIPFSLERQLVDYMTFQFRLIRRTTYEAVGGVDPAYVRAQDYELCLRLAEAAEVAQIDDVLYHYRDHDRSISRLHTCEQIEYCRRASEAAIERRGLADRLELSVQILPIFRLVPREPDASVPGDPES